MTPKRFNGFTLIELVVTLAIAGIVLGVAIPSFNSMMASNRLTAYANQLLTALNLARSEAVKRGLQVIVGRKGNTNKAWESGWDVYIDNNANNSYDAANDTLIKTYDALPSGYTLRTGDNFACWLAYKSNGLNVGSGSGCGGGGLPNDTFRLCDSSANTVNSRAIAINYVGRANVTVGNAASCP